LGLDYKLYSCEILFNRGICYMHLGEEELGRKDFETASKEKQLPDHARVDLTLSAGWKVGIVIVINGMSEPFLIS
jgi:hypothetical protein